MQLDQLDWIIVIVSIVVGFAPALFYMRRASSSSAEFFGSGRSAPWWLIGTSMVATTFSTDTPNLVTGWIRTSGVAKNWAWWSFLPTGMLTVFFFARLWRRSGVLTDLEFYELRYSGKPAAFVRGFRSIYLGLCFNCIIMASVTLAAVKIANIMLGWAPEKTVAWCAAICIVFSSISGLWGVLTTDLLQFAMAMTGVIAAAWYSLDNPKVGGLAGLLAKIPEAKLRLLPDTGAPDFNSTFLIPIALLWYSVWYPGAEPGGGSYIAQRMLAAKDERHALGGTLWFNVAHYALRPWPWIIVALASLLVFPELKDIQAAFPQLDPKLLNHDLAYPAMLTLLPHGLIGLLVAALLAAYVSTMTTHLNWGSSYLIHDFYRRFINGTASEKHYIMLSRLLAVVLTGIASVIVFQLDSAQMAFDLMLSIGAGTGLLYILRWFWWRVNPWSEIAAMGASLACAVVRLMMENAAKGAGTPWTDPTRDTATIVCIGLTTAAWVAVTLLTKPTDQAQLLRFYERVRPIGPGWAPIRKLARPDPATRPDSVGLMLAGCGLGILLVYGGLFGAGNFIYGRNGAAWICVGCFVVGAIGVWRVLAAMWAPAQSRIES